MNGKDNVQNVDVLIDLGVAYFEIDQPQISLTLLERAFAICFKHKGPDDIQLAIIMTNLGSTH